MKVLVTGANGHIGANVVRELLSRGHEVRAFVRESANLRGLEGLELERYYGDVMDLDSLIPAAQGCDKVIHLAAVYKTIADTPEEIVEPAVVGSRNIFEAAKAAGINRIVYTSSIASIGFGDSPDHMRTNQDWNDDAQNPYYLAKTESERVAQQLSREYDIELIVICPAIVLGAFDYRITPSNQLVMDWVNGLGQTYQGGLNLVDVRDVARAHVEALSKGENRGRYIVGGDNIEVKQIGRLLKELVGVKPMHLPTPRSVTLVFAAIIEKLSRLFGVRPLFTRDLVYEVVGRYGFYDCSITYQTFGFKPHSANEALVSALTWLAAQHKIKPKVAKRVEALAPEAKGAG